MDDEAKKARLQKIKQLLQGSSASSEASDDEAGATGQKNKLKKNRKSRRRGKSKKSADDPLPATKQPPHEEVTENGTLLIFTQSHHGDDVYEEDEDEDKFGYELEMFGTAEEDNERNGDEDHNALADDDSDSEIEFGQRKAIAIEEEDIAGYSAKDDPMNGSQFLLRAMVESRNLPKVAVADPELLRSKLAAKAVVPQVKQEAVPIQKRRRVRRKNSSTVASNGNTIVESVEKTVDQVVAGIELVGNPGDDERGYDLSHLSSIMEDGQFLHVEKTESPTVASSTSSEDEAEENEAIENISSPQKDSPDLDSFDQSELLPNPEWQRETLQVFTRLRDKVERQRQMLFERNPWEMSSLSLGQTVAIPDGGASEWFRFCFGLQCAYDIKSGKFRKPAPKITCHMDLTKFCREYLDQFFFRSESARSAVNSQHELSQLSASSEIKEVETKMNLVSLDEGERGHSQFQATILFSESENNLESSGIASSGALVPHSGYKPLLSIVLNIPQRTLEQLIGFNVAWLSENYNQFMNSQQCEWLYSLLACLQLPLEGSVVSDLRDIVRVCLKQRKLLATIMHKSRITNVRLEQEDDEAVKMYLNSLNLFITLVGNYFGQRDLLEGI